MTPLEAFRSFAAQPDDRLDLIRGALLIAAEEYPDLPLAPYQARIESLAASLLPRVAGRATPEALAETVRFLFEEEGFRGNEDDYYDPRNSFLNEVLDRRLGIPISLSVLLMEVARRVGVDLVGIGFPGHFLVGAHDLPDRFVDAFHRGKFLSRDDCARFFQERFGPRVTLKEAHFQPVGRREILVRMLRNLKGIYISKRDYARALSATDRIVHLSPELFEEVRDRGLLYASLDCPSPAIRDLERYLHVAAKAPDAEAVRERVLGLRGLVTAIH